MTDFADAMVGERRVRSHTSHHTTIGATVISSNRYFGLLIKCILTCSLHSCSQTNGGSDLQHYTNVSIKCLDSSLRRVRFVAASCQRQFKLEAVSHSFNSLQPNKWQTKYQREWWMCGNCCCIKKKRHIIDMPNICIKFCSCVVCVAHKVCHYQIRYYSMAVQ